MHIKLTIAALAAAMSSPAIAQEVYGPPDEEEAVFVAPVESAEEARQRIKRENWRRVRPLAFAVMAIDVADIITTHKCSKSPRCHEGNSLYGSRNPSLGTILAIKGAEMAATWIIAREVSEREPVAGFTFLGVRAVVTGSTVMSNIKILW